jgi:Ca2+/Na+ antiporter
VDPGTIGLVGGIVGSVIGVLGGFIGTYFSIKNTKTAAERRFAVKCALGAWVACALLIGLPLVLWLMRVIPQWLYWVAYALFYVFLIPTIIWTEKRRAALHVRNDLMS